MLRSETPVLYFHAPCFDGVASAVLLLDFLEGARGWTGTRLVPVGYRAKATWLARRLPRRSAVVDFLFHPRAQWWADHHSTTFHSELPDLAPAFARGGGWWFGDDDSCAGLLWDQLWADLGHRNERLDELVHWAERIDGARFARVDDAFDLDAPALQIHASLHVRATADYSRDLVAWLRQGSLAETASRPEVQSRVREYERRSESGLERFRRHSELRGDVVVFDVNVDGVVLNRYAPYLSFPDASYSVGVLRSHGQVKVTAMRNPWREFESIDLGAAFASFGGGGHHRVASVLLPPGRASATKDVLESIVAQLQLGGVRR